MGRSAEFDKGTELTVISLLLAAAAVAQQPTLPPCGLGPPCRLAEARALLSEGRADEAAAVAKAVREAAGALGGYAALVQGDALLVAGRPAEAADAYRAVTEEGPARLRASAGLAKALMQAGLAAEAALEADRSAALAGQPVEVRADLAWLSADARARSAETEEAKTAAAHALRAFWLHHPQHPSAEAARDEEQRLAALPPPPAAELLQRAQRLLAAGRPGAAVAQTRAAAAELTGAALAEAHLIEARALAADGRRSEAVTQLQDAWLRGAAKVAAPAGLLLARDRARRGLNDEALALVAQLSKRFRGAPEAEEGQLLAARIELDVGRKDAARARLGRLTQPGTASALTARWLLAWLSYRDGEPFAAKRFREFVRVAQTDPERAQGKYWEARAGEPGKAAALYEEVARLDPLGWYGLLARERLGAASANPAPFPRPPPALAAGALPPRLALASSLLELGLTNEAAAELDWFVERSRPDAIVLALPLYERAARYDREVIFADAFLGRPGVPRALLEAAYPTAYPEPVAASAQRVRLDPWFLLAVMRRESLFKPEARSAAGAVGLLQLLPATARRAATVLGRPALKDEELVQPPVAIDLGAWYLAELVGRFGDPAVAAAAYNAGPRVAMPWAASGAGRPLDEWVEDIPYRETRKYVKVVIGAWGAYRTLAGGSAPKLSETVPAPRAGAAF